MRQVPSTKSAKIRNHPPPSMPPRLKTLPYPTSLSSNAIALRANARYTCESPTGKPATVRHVACASTLRWVWVGREALAGPPTPQPGRTRLPDPLPFPPFPTPSPSLCFSFTPDLTPILIHIQLTHHSYLPEPALPSAPHRVPATRERDAYTSHLSGVQERRTTCKRLLLAVGQPLTQRTYQDGGVHRFYLCQR